MSRLKNKAAKKRKPQVTKTLRKLSSSPSKSAAKLKDFKLQTHSFGSHAPVKIAIVMGSDSDWPVMQKATEALNLFKVSYAYGVLSAHRTPQEMLNFAQQAQQMKLEIIIAGAGGAAHLPGMIASNSDLPVVGVPIKSLTNALEGHDALYSVVQMPAGVPVACVGINQAYNAGLLALKILAISDAKLRQKLRVERDNMREKSLHKKISV